MFRPIQTERLDLRKLLPGDAARLFDYRSDPDIARYQSWDPASADEIADFLAGTDDAHFLKPGRWFQVGIIERASGRIIGDCGIHAHADEPRQVELGITLARESQRLGFGREALGGVIGFLFRETETHRIWCSVDPRNVASTRLMERLGLRKEAHLRESLWLGGAWADNAVFAVLRREWPTTR